MSRCGDTLLFNCFFGDCVNASLIDMDRYNTSKLSYNPGNASIEYESFIDRFGKNASWSEQVEYCKCWKGFNHSTLFLYQRNCAVPTQYYPVITTIGILFCLTGLYKSSMAGLLLQNKNQSAYRVAVHAALVNVFFFVIVLDVSLSHTLTPWTATAFIAGAVNAVLMAGYLVVVLLAPIRQSISRSYSNKYDYVFEFWRVVFTIVAPIFICFTFSLCFGIAFLYNDTTEFQLSDAIYYLDNDNTVNEGPGTVKYVSDLLKSERGSNNWLMGVVTIIASVVLLILSLAVWFADKLILQISEILPSKVRGKEPTTGRLPSPSIVSSVDGLQTTRLFSLRRHSEDFIGKILFLGLAKPSVSSRQVRVPSIPISEDVLDSEPAKSTSTNAVGNTSAKATENVALSETDQKRDKFLLEYIKSVKTFRVFSLWIGLPITVICYLIVGIYFGLRELPFDFAFIDVGLMVISIWTYKCSSFLVEISTSHAEQDIFQNFRMRAPSKRNLTKDSNAAMKGMNRREDTAPAPPTAITEERVYHGTNILLRSNFISSDADKMTVDNNSKHHDPGSLPNSTHNYPSENSPTAKKHSTFW